MHKIIFEWMEGNQTRSQTISSDEQTIIAKKIRIGRDPSLCDVVVKDSTNKVSRLHAEIYFNQKLDSFCVRNATWNQTNPNIVLVDEILVTEEEKPIHSGSILKLRDIPLKIAEIQLNPSTVINNPSPQPTYQNSPNPSKVMNNPSPQPVGKGNIKLGASILQRASQDDFDAIATMFKQFIPQDEQIHIARYLGRRGLCGIGTRNFACVTDSRVAHITTGYFGEITYQDGYLEHINSGAIYHPSRFLLCSFLFTFLSFLFISLFVLGITLVPFFILLSQTDNSNIDYNSISQYASYITMVLLTPVAIRWFYSIIKSGLVLTVKEGQLYLSPIGGFAFGQRLMHIFANPKFVTRANSIYRYFIIQKETRLNQVEKYPLPNQQKNSSRLTAISLSSSPQNYPDNNARTGVFIGLGVGALGLVGISLAALSINSDPVPPTPIPTPPNPIPTTTSAVDNLQEINQKLDNAIRQELGDNPICEQDLVYQLITNQDGIIIAYKPLNKVSSKNFSMTPLPKLIASAKIPSDQEPYALFQVVFKANGELEVTSLDVMSSQS